MQENKVSILIKKSELVLEKIVNPMLAEYELTASQYRVLKFIYAQGTDPVRAIDIERYYSMTHPTVLALLDGLEKHGFIVREQDKRDGRSRVILLSKHALELRETLESLGDTMEQAFCEKLSSAEQRQSVGLLKKLLG